MLKIENLSVQIEDYKILKDFNINVKAGEIHGIMGPNGTGKSTICKTIIGDEDYTITSGNIFFNDKSILDLDITQRSRLGIYLVSQSPTEIPGVTNAEMLRVSLSEKTGKFVDIFDFNTKIENICKKLDIPLSFIHRGINEGMSGGEKKKNELLHLWMLEPKLIILDELDSGLDVDSIKTVVKNIKEYQKEHNSAVVIITHGSKLLKMLKATHVHILNDGTIKESGDLDLALKIENQGYKNHD